MSHGWQHLHRADRISEETIYKGRKPLGADNDTDNVSVQTMSYNVSQCLIMSHNGLVIIVWWFYD